MLKEVLQNKKQRGNHVRAMHLHQEFDTWSEEYYPRGNGFVAKLLSVATINRLFALAASDDDDSEDCADPAIVAEGLPVYDGSDDNHDIYVEKGKGPVETYVTTDVDNVEAGATTDVRRSARVSMKPAMFKLEKPKSRTPRHSTSKKLKKPVVPGQDDISYPTSGQECIDSQSEEEHIADGVRIRKLESHFSDQLDAANSVHAIGTPACVTKASIAVKVVDCRLEPEEAVIDSGSTLTLTNCKVFIPVDWAEVSTSVGSGGKVKPDASVPGGRHAGRDDDDEGVPELVFSSSDEE